MKRLALFILAIIGMSCAFSFPAPAQEPQQEPGIVGTWTIPITFQGETATLYIRFDASGRYWQWSPEGNAQGSYSTYGDELKIFRTDGQELNSRFHLAGPNILILEGRNGEFKYSRVADAAPQTSEPGIAGQNQVFQDSRPESDIHDENKEAENSGQPQDTPYDRGCKFLEQGDLKHALSAFNQAIAQDSNNAPALYKRGLVYKKMNDPVKSFDDFAAALDLDPDNDEYHNAMESVGSAAITRTENEAWNAAKELQKKHEKERLSRQFPYRLAGSVISILILAAYWFFYFRTKKPSETPRSGSAKFFRVLVLIFGIALTLFIFLFVSGSLKPYFTSY